MPTQGCLVRPPQFTQHHPNSLRHLPQHSNWEIVIDETGMEFEQAEDLSIDDYSLGRYVALAIPEGKAELDRLPETFHAAEEKPELLDKVINNILSQSVGVLGITAKDPLSFNRPRWFDLLAGTDALRKQILTGVPEAEIRATWQSGLDEYKQMRKKYLLYPDYPVGE